MEAGGSVVSTADKARLVQPKGMSSITERLLCTSTEKVHSNSESKAGIHARTSPNNNISPSGVLSKIFNEPFSNSSSSSNDSKNNGKCAKPARNNPSPDHIHSSGRVSESIEDQLMTSSGGNFGDGSILRALSPVAVEYPDCNSSSSSIDPTRCIGMKTNPLPQSDPNMCTEPKDWGEYEEVGSGSNRQTNDNNGNARARVLSVTGRHCDKLKLEDGVGSVDRSTKSVLQTERSRVAEGDRRNDSKNLHSPTDSSLYHLRMHPGHGSALSESVNETAHSELSDNCTANQLSEQYCSSAEIASTSSICSRGQTKDVRSPRDVT
jgi:hypothetical protein